MSTPSTPFDFASNSRKLTSLNRPQYGSPFAQLSLRPRTSLPSISNLASQQQTRFLTFTPNGSRSLNQSIRNQQNPFEELSAGEFENFVDSVKRKIREALEPPAPSRDDAMINDEQDGMDVFGQVKDLREESTHSQDVMMDDSTLARNTNDFNIPVQSVEPEEIIIDDSSSEVEYLEEDLEQENGDMMEREEAENFEAVSEQELEELKLAEQEEDDYLDERDDYEDDSTLLLEEAEAEWSQEVDSTKDSVQQCGGFISASRFLAESSPPREDEFDTDSLRDGEESQNDSESDEGDLTMDQLFPTRASIVMEEEATPECVDNRIPTHLKGKGRATGTASISPSRSTSPSSSTTTDGESEQEFIAKLARVNSTNLLKHCQSIHDQLQDHHPEVPAYEKTQNLLLQFEEMYRWRIAAEEAGEELSDAEDDESSQIGGEEEEGPSTDGEVSFEHEGTDEQEGQWSKNAVLSAAAKRKAERARKRGVEERQSSIDIAGQSQEEESDHSEKEQNSPPPTNGFELGPFSPGQIQHTEAVASQLVDMHTAGLEPCLAVPIMNNDEVENLQFFDEPILNNPQQSEQDLASFLVELSQIGALETDIQVPIGIQDVTEILQEDESEEQDELFSDGMEIYIEEGNMEEVEIEEPAPLESITLSSSPERSPSIEIEDIDVVEQYGPTSKRRAVVSQTPEVEEEVEEEGVDENIAPDGLQVGPPSSPPLELLDDSVVEEDVEMIVGPRPSSYEILADSVPSESLNNDTVEEAPVTSNLLTTLSLMAQEISDLKANVQGTNYEEEDTDESISEDTEDEVEILPRPILENENLVEPEFALIDMDLEVAPGQEDLLLGSEAIEDTITAITSTNTSMQPSAVPLPRTDISTPFLEESRLNSSVIDFSLRTTTPISDAGTPQPSNLPMTRTSPTALSIQQDLTSQLLPLLANIPQLYPTIPPLDNSPVLDTTSTTSTLIDSSPYKDDASTSILSKTLDELVPVIVESEMESARPISEDCLVSLVEESIDGLPLSDSIVHELVTDNTILPSSIINDIEDLSTLESTLELSPIIYRSEGILDDDDFPALSETEETLLELEEEDEEEVEIIEVGSPLLDDDFIEQQSEPELDVAEDESDLVKSVAFSVMENVGDRKQDGIEIEEVEIAPVLSPPQNLDTTLDLPVTPILEPVIETSTKERTIEQFESTESQVETPAEVTIISNPVIPIDVTTEGENVDVEIIESTETSTIATNQQSSKESTPAILGETTLEKEESSEDELTLIPSIKSELSRKLHSPSFAPMESTTISPSTSILGIRQRLRSASPVISRQLSLSPMKESKKRSASAIPVSPQPSRRLRSSSPAKVDKSISTIIRPLTLELEEPIVKSTLISPGSTRQLRSGSPFVSISNSIPLVSVSNSSETIPTTGLSTRQLRSTSSSKQDSPAPNPILQSNLISTSPITRRLRSNSPFESIPIQEFTSIDPTKSITASTPRSNTKRNRPSETSSIIEPVLSNKKQRRKDEKKEKKEQKEASTKKVRNIKL